MTCPLCGSGRSRRVLGSAPFNIVRCSCGFCYAGADAPDEPYDEAYYRRWGMGTPREAGLAAMKRKSYGRLLDQVAGAGAGSGRLLDIGCGLGYSVEEAVSRGYDAIGIETSPFASAEAERRLPGRIRRGFLQQARLADASFRVVTLVDVIEHLRDPLGLLREIARITAPDGFLALTTPDLSSLSAALLGARWPYIIPEHVAYFDRHTLRRALEATGWRLRRIGPVRKSLRVDYVREIFAARRDALGRVAAGLLAPLPDAADIGFFAGDVVVVAQRIMRGP